jgi:hypothetical protein
MKARDRQRLRDLLTLCAGTTPARIDGATVTGPGWTLSVAAGSIVKPAVQPGSFVVVPQNESGRLILATLKGSPYLASGGPC